MKKQASKAAKRRVNPLAVAAGLVLLAALSVTALPKHTGQSAGSSSTTETSVPSGSDLTLRTEEIGTEASFFDYDAGGITVQVLAVRASDDTVRLALNTCQVCNGSPYAYFEQDGDDFVCQNCHNRFASTAVGIVSGGCDPVPITADVYEEKDGTLTVPHSFLEENAPRFENWKKF